MRPWAPSYWFLVWELTRTEFKLRDQGTVLGFLWTLLHPALMFLVLHTLFIKWLGHHVDDYGSYLLVGLVQWQFFDKATTAGLSAPRRKANLIRNFSFAREIVVFASVGSVLISYLLELAVMLAFLAAWGSVPDARWLGLPALVAALMLLTLGTALLLALAAARFPDVERVWGILLTAGFYATPVFFPLKLISPEWQGVMRLNPMLHVLEAFRGCLLAGGSTDWPAVAGVLAVGAAAAAAGIAAFHRWERSISDLVLTP